MRVARFARSVWSLRSLVFRSPIDCHNLKSCWAQSDPDWMSKLGSTIEMTEEEFDAWLEAIK